MIWTKEYRLERQRLRRSLDGNSDTKKYEKSPKGFLMRLYRNMKSRVDGVQKLKFHLYEGKELLPKEEFYSWSTSHPQFLSLFETYKENNFQRKLAPSVDRIDSSKGYNLDNMEWITMQENSRRGLVSRHQKNSSHS